MSSFLNLTPTVRVALKNPFSGERYPATESVLAVIDTGYEGFMAAPTDVFNKLGFNELQQERRTLVLANGTVLKANGVYGGVEMPHLASEMNGFIETYEGLDEIILGVDVLSRFKSTLDYCTQRITIEQCL